MPLPNLPNLPAIEIVAAVVFGCALVHTFAAKQFERLSRRLPQHAGLFHLLGEVEVVFGFWALVLIVLMAGLSGGDAALAYAESRQYTEPLFVFVVMVIAASRPVLQTVMALTGAAARRLPMRTSLATAWLSLAAVPLLGSAITEPAAMTIAALMLAPQVFRPDVPERVKYLALGVLFVNISIGGTLTSFAAPPVLMVAAAWQWDSMYMLQTFGWKAAVAVVVNASVATYALRAHLPEVVADADADAAAAASSSSSSALGLSTAPLRTVPTPARNASPGGAREGSAPLAVVLVHLAFLAGVVALAHHPVAFLGLFLMFLGFSQAYERYQSPLIIREALLVAFFLAGLVVLGGLQQWWLQPIVAGMSPEALFFGATALTAVTDNAALTYLGSLMAGISDEAKYSLVAGAVAGGGLTMIANAPNPAGVALLKQGFSDETISAGGLLVGALAPTLVAVAAFTLLK